MVEVVVVVVAVVQLVKGCQGVLVELPHCGYPRCRHLVRFEMDIGVHVPGCLLVVDVDPHWVLLIANPDT